MIIFKHKPLQIAFRFPSEFFKYVVFSSWLFHTWKYEEDFMRGWGFRVLGFEVSSTKYKYLDY